MAKIDLKIDRKKGESEIGRDTHPSFYVSDKDLPVGKDDVGKTLLVKMVVKFTGYSMNNSTKANHKSYTFAMQSIEFLNGAVEAVKSQIKKQG